MAIFIFQNFLPKEQLDGILIIIIIESYLNRKKIQIGGFSSQ